MSSVKVTLRKRTYESGKTVLYLDFYPAIRNPKTMKMTRREYLGIYLYTNPRTPHERKVNAQKMKQAEGIRAQRELSIINEQYGFLDKTTGRMSVLAYFQSILKDHHRSRAGDLQGTSRLRLLPVHAEMGRGGEPEGVII